MFQSVIITVGAVMIFAVSEVSEIYADVVGIRMAAIMGLSNLKKLLAGIGALRKSARLQKWISK